MYKGMKWYKCDLQMQTPGDQLNWLQDDPCYLRGEYTEDNLNDSVDMYLKRCHEVGLDAVGITDHNFIGRYFLQRLIERNGHVATEVGRDPLIIFPGFEIEISQGNGVHLLCLYDPTTPLQVIDDIVTALGLPTTRRVQSGRILPANTTFEDVIRTVQEDPEHKGIVIAAHPLSESGMLNDRFLPEYFQQYMLTDSRLLAIEIPAPLESLSKGWQTLLKSGRDCHPDWQRQHPIATVMSSDCYSLCESDKGYIGKRHSWIRMSESTIEALRQAMKDHQSRICLQTENPEDGVRYGRIKSIKIKNVAFLEDQTIEFSPNFNCIIGGRGSGKSSLLEYIRLCANYEIKDVNIDNLNRIKNTLNENAVLQLMWEDLSGTDLFQYSLSNNCSNIISRGEEVTDPHTIFEKLGIQIYSQRQISNIANHTENLLSIIDQITGDEIKSLIQQEHDIRDEIRTYQQEKNKLNRKMAERRELNQEIIELQRQWDAFVAVREENKKRLNAQDAKKYLERVDTETDELVAQWEANAETVTAIHEKLIFEEKDWTNKEFFEKLDRGILQAKQKFVNEVKTALQKYKQTITKLTTEDEEWKPLQENLDSAESEFIQACKREGLKPEELEILKDVNEKKNDKETRLGQLDLEIVELLDKNKKLEGLFESLYELWKKQTEIRITKVNSLLASGSIPRISSNNEPFIKVEIQHMADSNSFFKYWNNIKVNRATRLGKSWEEIGAALFEGFLKCDEYDSPWDLLIEWAGNKDSLPATIREYHAQLEELLNKEQSWDDLMLKRIGDQIDITLYRDDGTRAGSLLDNGLSDGQKNTAILTLLFTDGESPIIIDQPEDELDSDFIYNQLVPLIRNVKNKRQIIVASHNANLPVNGDAELVHALRTDMGCGIVRDQGGLDKENVRKSILDIMEGSEEAFRKRQEKYYS